MGAGGWDGVWRYGRGREEGRVSRWVLKSPDCTRVPLGFNGSECRSRIQAQGCGRRRKGCMALNKRHQACTVLLTIHLPAIQQNVVRFLNVHRAP
jgi:hypothetical protein